MALPMDLEQHLFQRLGEEGCEISQAVSKVMVFTTEEIQPGLTRSNAQRLMDEIADLLGVYELLNNHGLLPKIERSRVIAKQKKVAEFLKVSHELGTIDKSPNLILSNPHASMDYYVEGIPREETVKKADGEGDVNGWGEHYPEPFDLPIRLQIICDDTNNHADTREWFTCVDIYSRGIPTSFRFRLKSRLLVGKFPKGNNHQYTSTDLYEIFKSFKQPEHIEFLKAVWEMISTNSRVLVMADSTPDHLKFVLDEDDSSGNETVFKIELKEI